MNVPLDRQGCPASRTADLETVERAVRLVASPVDGITLTSIEVVPYRGTTSFRAVAEFRGGIDRDTVVDFSEEVAELLTSDVMEDWIYSGDIQCDHGDGSFRLSIGFTPRKA